MQHLKHNRLTSNNTRCASDKVRIFLHFPLRNLDGSLSYNDCYLKQTASYWLISSTGDARAFSGPGSCGVCKCNYSHPFQSNIDWREAILLCTYSDEWVSPNVWGQHWSGWPKQEPCRKCNPLHSPYRNRTNGVGVMGKRCLLNYQPLAGSKRRDK